MMLSFHRRLALPDWRIDVSQCEPLQPLLQVEPGPIPRERFVEGLRAYREYGFTHEGKRHAVLALRDAGGIGMPRGTVLECGGRILARMLPTPRFGHVLQIGDEALPLIEHSRWRWLSGGWSVQRNERELARLDYPGLWRRNRLHCRNGAALELPLLVFVAVTLLVSN
jgi:hypothetical protein